MKYVLHLSIGSYKKHMKKKKRICKGIKTKAAEDKAKALIALNKSTYNKGEILRILHWKLGDEYNIHKDKRVAELQLLLSQYAGMNPADILLPPTLKTHPSHMLMKQNFDMQSNGSSI
jgi:hypothetical protein